MAKHRSARPTHHAKHTVAKRLRAVHARHRRRIGVTYDIVTPESAEDGDVAERGWINEGIPIDGVREAIRMLKYDGPFEPSSSAFHKGVWYTESEGDTDYHTGAVETKSYHLYGFTEAEERVIFNALTKRSR
jgi:hypothetical protein